MISQKQVTFEAVTSLIYDRKFDTALRKTTICEFLKRLNENTLTPDDKLITLSNHVDLLNEAQCDGRLYSIILKDILVFSSSQKLYNPYFCKTINRASDILCNVINLQWEYMNNQNNLPEYLNTKKLRYQWLSSLNFTAEIQNLLTLGSSLERIITNLNKIKDRKYRAMDETTRREALLKINHASIKEIDLTLVWSEKMVYMEYKGKAYIFPRSYILLIYNKIHDLVSVLVYALGSSGNALPKTTMNVTLSFILELIQLHLQYKEKFFTIAKTLESICIAETLCEVELWKNKQFLISIQVDLETSIGFDYLNSDICRILKMVPVHLRHELCCLSKILGHPFVDMEEGTKDLFNKVQESLDIDLLKVNECTNYVKENYIRNYIYRHGKWPPCIINSSEAPKTLAVALAMNKDPNAIDITRKYGKIEIHHYNYIDLLPSMRFSKLENYIPYLKDKTVTLCRNKLFKRIWPSSQEDMKESWRETRLLLVYLLNSNLVLNHVEYLDNYNNSMDLEDLLDYLVIRIVPKEKELKTSYRGFGCKTYEDRARALCQEKSAMEFLDNYSDEQAMTLGELPLIRKLYSFRTLLHSYAGHRIIYINLDASSWNNRFRRATVDQVMSYTLDPIFDTKIFQKTHLAYEKTFFYVPDESQVHYWNGQAGGIEGLNQDTWVVAYLGQIKSAMKPLGFQYYVLCKGDDVRVAVLIPPVILKNKLLTDIKDEIVKSLKVSLQNFGHTIKVNDSYGSEVYFSFSKSASISTVELPQVFRKIQKSHGANNAFINTLDEYIASAFSNAHSSCKVSPNVTPVYSVGVFWSLYYLMNHLNFRSLSDTEYVSLMLTPSLVGGFPIIYLHNMFVRAESDLLSPFIGFLSFMRHRNYEIFTIMSNFLKFTMEPPDSYVSLYKDPYAIPLHRPTLPTTMLRKQIIPSLRKLTRNEGLRELFDLIDSPINEDIMACLDSCNVKSVKILSNVYSATPNGLLEELLRKFETSRSVYELLILRGGEKLAYQVIKRVYHAEKVLQSWRFRRLRGIDRKNLECYIIRNWDCPAQIAQELREKLWRCKIEGITMPPLQHQIKFTTEWLSFNNTWDLNNHFTYHCKSDLKAPEFKHCPQQYMSGGCKPFMGYTTRSGTIAPTVHFIEKDAILTKVKNLLDLLSWTAKEKLLPSGEVITSNFYELLHYVIKLYSPEDVSKLGPFSGKQRSGTVQHHMRSPSFKESIVPNILSNIYQQVIGVTNSHLKMRQSKDHFKINFLHIYCYAVSVMFEPLEFSSARFGSDEVWAVTTKCDYCNVAIEETPLVCNVKKLRLHNVRPLSLTSVGKLSEKLLMTSVREFENTGIKIAEIPTELTYEVACGGVLQEFIDQTYTSRILLSERYSLMRMTDADRSIHVHLAPQGKTRDIGQTEIKGLSPEMICKYVIPKIYLETMLKYPMSNVKTISTILSSVPGNELPWFGLIENLYRSGQLGRFIYQLRILSGVAAPACYDNPARASHYVGVSSYVIQEKNPLASTFVLLSLYTDSDILRHLRPYVLMQIRRILVTEFHPQLNDLKRLPPTEESKKLTSQFAAIFILYSSINIHDETLNELIRFRIKDIRQGEFQILSTDMTCQNIYEYNSLGEYVKEEMNHYLNWQLSLYPDIPWEDGFTYLTENYDFCLAVLETYMVKTKVKIVYTDLPTCIAYIRGYQVYDEILDDLEIPHQLPPQADIPDWSPVIRAISSRAMEYKLLPGEIQTNLYHPAFYDFVHVKVVLQRCYVDRPYCSITSSQNKIIEILSYVGLPIPLGNNLSIACLGEGYGGILDCIARASTRSKFLFCTLPPNVEVETYPYAAFESIRNNGHQVLFAHHSIGYYDLSKVSTLLHFEQYEDLYKLIVCDAEVGDYLSASRADLIKNVVVFFLRRRTQDGVLILKMNACEGDNIHKALGYLTHYISDSLMFRCRSSGIGGEFYLIAYGNQTRFDINYDSFPVLPNLLNYTKVEKFRGYLFRVFHDTITQSHRSIEWKVRTEIHRHRWKVLRLQSNGLSKMQSLCDFNISHNDYEYYESSATLRQKCKKIYNTFISVPEVNYKMIWDLTDIEQRLPTWDPATRRHKTILGEKWLRQQGCLHIFRYIYESEDSPPIYEQELRNHFLSLLPLLPKRLKWNHNTSFIFRSETHDGSFVSRPYYNFINGVNIALSAIGYFLVYST